MARRNVFLVFASGLLTGVVGMIALSGGHAVPRAMAQVPAAAAVSAPGRFQVAAWAHPGAFSTGGGFVPASYGAYILDIQTGRAWTVKEGGKPVLIGTAE